MNFAEYCNSLADACGEGGVWVKDHDEIVRNEQESLQKDLRRAARTFRRCARAADRKMCAGVFGPSQAGKSYLISALARDAQGKLIARFGQESHDFISEINPEGGKESTGLVTRFTMTPPTGLPAGNPVCIRLLTETDLVKIIANTYYADCEHKEETQSNIPATLDSLGQRAREQNSRIDLDALEDLRDYLTKEFRAKARVQELERSYWEQALAIGPRLSLNDRIRLYALIWDEVDEFTRLLTTLLNALEQLGHAEEAYCPMTALIPRETSIIDVANLAGLDGSAGGKGDSLTLVTSGGRRATLPRAVVTALTAELVIVMQEKPAPYFEHTDLLDFPGYRSRYKFDDVRRELGKKDILKEMFLRGKVAYLFQRYCADRELTSMLLCIGPSNQEVQDLPGVINEWIKLTHGETPAERRGAQVSLFFILTKFDMDFEQKKGAPSVETRWDNRLHASLLDFFGKQHDWPTVWDGQGGAFNNMFLLRNPNFRFDSILKYTSADPNATETGIRDDMKDYVDKLESAFMRSNLVAAHFKDPRKAWDAAMLLNDGGITYIRESLSPLCNPDIKRRQLEQSVESTQRQVHARLKAFYQSDDKDELRSQKFAMYQALVRNLQKLEKNTHRLGRLINTLTVSGADIFHLYPEAYRRFLAQTEELEEQQDNLEEIPVEAVDPNNVGDIFDDFEEQEAKSDAPPKPVRDEAAFFADYIESTWVGRLHSQANDAAQQKHFMLPEQQFAALVSELATGAFRMGLHDTMAMEFRHIAAYVTNRDDIVRQQACFAAYTINNFVSWLGFNPLHKDEAQRTVKWKGTTTRVLFSPPPEVKRGKFPELQEARSNYTTTWFTDWMMGFHALVMDNVTFDGKQFFDEKANEALGLILKKLAPKEVAAKAAQA